MHFFFYAYSNFARRWSYHGEKMLLDCLQLSVRTRMERIMLNRSGKKYTALPLDVLPSAPSCLLPDASPPP